MLKHSLVIASAAAALSFGLQAQANPIPFSFQGATTSGSGFISIAPDVSPPDPNPGCGPAPANPCRSDPPSAYRVTSISGTVSDPAHGLVNVAITGLVPIAPANERDPTFDPLVPSSLSFVGDSSVYFSYDNLFYPAGAPIVCDFPFTGTFVDPFGVAFALANGDVVDLWGDGNLDFGPLTYGVGILTYDASTDTYSKPVNQFAGVAADFAVPEPGSVWVFAAGLLLLGGLALRPGLLGRGRSTG